jgi:hypothetical protein
MEKLLVLSLIAAAVIDKSLADRIVVNADNIINKLYIDGVDKTGALVNRKKWQQCDKIDIPYNSGVIAIEALNLKSFYGIQECATANAKFEDWRCRRVTKAQSGSWYMPNYRAKYWKFAKSYRCKKHCRKYYKQPCKLYNTKCYWTNKYARRVRCRVKLCADNCGRCKIAGPKKCDPGYCNYGAGPTGECRRCCRVEIKLYSILPNEIRDAYLTITDVTGSPTKTVPMGPPGLYAVALDISTCSIVEVAYWPFESANFPLWFGITAPSVSKWGEPDSKYTNLLGFKFQVGPGVSPTSSTLMYKYDALGIGTATLAGENTDSFRPCLYRATFCAAPGEKAQMSNEEVIGDTDQDYRTTACYPK